MDAIRPKAVTELQDLVGSELGPSDWHTLTQSEIDVFAALTGDHQWIHVDPVRAADGVFGSTIGHGLFTLALGPVLFAQLMAFDGFAHSLNYGYDRVRFPHPRPVGNRVRMLAHVDDVTVVAPKTAHLTTTQTFWSDTATKPICVAQFVVRFVEHDSPSQER